MMKLILPILLAAAWLPASVLVADESRSKPRLIPREGVFLDIDGVLTGKSGNPIAYEGLFSSTGYAAGADPTIEPSDELVRVFQDRERNEYRPVSASAFFCDLETRTVHYDDGEVMMEVPIDSVRRHVVVSPKQKMALCWSVSVNAPVPSDVLFVLMVMPNEEYAKILFFVAHHDEPTVWQISWAPLLFGKAHTHQLFEEGRWGLFQEKDQIVMLIPFHRGPVAYEMHLPEDLKESTRFHLFPVPTATESVVDPPAAER